jgi:hypothetical protein
MNETKRGRPKGSRNYNTNLRNIEEENILEHIRIECCRLQVITRKKIISKEKFNAMLDKTEDIFDRVRYYNQEISKIWKDENEQD